MRNLLALLCLASLAAAQETPELKRARAFLTGKDSDGDGRLSAAELGAPAERFARIDANGDGFVEAEEILAARTRRKGGAGADARRGRAARIFQRLDRDGDGRIAGDELPQGGRLDVDRADRNGDGAIDRGELAAYLEAAGRDRRRGGRGAAGGRMLERLKALDTNGDGAVDRSEWKGDDRMFGRLDPDGDGRIDLARLERRARSGAGRGARLQERLKRMDGNGDGAIDREEWKGPTRIFERLDGDGDGKVTAGEMQAARRALRGRGRFSDRTSEAVFRRFDSDGDGRITPDEWKLRRELFDKLDADGDGSITRAEVTPRGPRGRRRGRGSRYDVASGKDSETFLARHDRDRDGQVARDEFPHARRFKEIDADGDGVLTKQEVEDAMERGRRERAFDVFERFDLDRDGTITRQEFTGPAAAFERLDRNADGVIDARDGSKDKQKQKQKQK